MEIWRDIKGYEGHYMVSNYGRVKTLKQNTAKIGSKILCNEILKFGYHRVTLTINNISKKILVHRLVATAFIDNPHQKQVVNHKDCNTSNNHVDNLEWVTQDENMKYSKKLGRKLLYSNGVRNVDLHKKFGVSKTHISRIVNNKIRITTA